MVPTVFGPMHRLATDPGRAAWIFQSVGAPRPTLCGTTFCVTAALCDADWSVAMIMTHATQPLAITRTASGRRHCATCEHGGPSRGQSRSENRPDGQGSNPVGSTAPVSSLGALGISVKAGPCPSHGAIWTCNEDSRAPVPTFQSLHKLFQPP